jgi:4-hydroxybenzoyl-CoA reductase subunit beta
MLRMDGFTYQAASSAEEAVHLWHSHEEAAYIAGGTDLLPNIKHRIEKPRVLIGLGKAIPRGWSVENGEVVIGAGTTLTELSACTELPAVATAAGLVAGPQLRNMGTLGGNVMLDTRCLFLNQSAHWRQSLGHCLKAEGTWCHVVGGPKTCVATQSSDTVPALMAHDARLRVLGPEGPREIALADLFRFDGIDNHSIAKGHLITHVVVPVPPANHRARYDKLRTRGAIDFPQLSVAIAGEMSGEGEACVAHSLTIVVGAINPRPQAIKGVEKYAGRTLDDATVRELGELVQKRCRPQGSVHGSPAWRRSMARITVERGLKALRG